MAARDNQYVESLGSSTQTTTTPTDKAAITFTAAQQVAGAQYAVIWSAIVRNQSNTTADVRCRLRDDTASADRAEALIEMQDASNYHPVMGMVKFTAAGSPVDQAWSIEYWAETSGNTVEIRSAAIAIVRFDAQDQYGESLGTSTNTTATLSDKTTLTFTPGTAGDYIFVATAEGNITDAAGSNIRFVLDVDGTPQADEHWVVQDAANWQSWSALYTVNLTAVSHTAKIRFSFESGGAGTTSIRNARLLAIRKDVWEAWAGGAARASTNTTSTTYQTKASFTTTPVAVNQLLLSQITIEKRSTTEDGFGRAFNGTTAFAEMNQEGNTINATNNEWAFLIVRRITGSGASTTFSTQFRAETLAATYAFDSEIMLFQLDASITTAQIAAAASVHGLRPIPRRPPSVYRANFEPVWFSGIENPAADPMGLIDRWYRPPEPPARRRPNLAALAAAGAINVGEPIAAPAVPSLDWYSAPGQVRARIGHNRGPSMFEPPLGLDAAPAPPLDWHWQPVPPARRRPATAPRGEFSAVFAEPTPVVPDFGWFSWSAQPLRRRARARADAGLFAPLLEFAPPGPATAEWPMPVPAQLTAQRVAAQITQIGSQE